MGNECPILIWLSILESKISNRAMYKLIFSELCVLFFHVAMPRPKYLHFNIVYVHRCNFKNKNFIAKKMKKTDEYSPLTEHHSAHIQEYL